MKFKSILFAALAFFVSCETSSVDNIYSSSEDVTFLISQDNSNTKGTPIDRAEDLSKIGVFAVLTQGPYAEATSHEPEFMFNQLVEHKGNTWEYNPRQMWSSKPGELISFFAYAPYATSENGITFAQEDGKMPTIRYQVPQTNSEQPDLMFATPALDRFRSHGTVGLKFRHALAAISFSVRGDSSSEITAVKLHNVVGAATLSLESTDATWCDFADQSTLSYDLGVKGGVTPPTDGETAASITASNGYLMMIPQDIADIEIEVMVDGQSESIDLNFPPGSEWVAGARYNYIIDLETNSVHFDISQTSNCYIVKNTGIKDIYIPIDQRINAFWQDYSGLSEAISAKYMIDDSSEWTPKVEWSDNEKLKNTTVACYKGDIPGDCSTSKSFVCDGTNAVMKVTLPDNCGIGNILISVSKEIDHVEQILWSWHLWVTDYDPDSKLHEATTAVEYDVAGGKIHRYTINSTAWTTGLYANTFTMDRDIGSHDENSTDGLFYQWGRKDPFSVIADWTKKEKLATFATAVQNPNIFYVHEKGWCKEPKNGGYGNDNYLWYDITLLNCDDNAFKKSIFDPSPLGWCVPMNEAYAEWGDNDKYEGIVHHCLSGDIHPTLGVLQCAGSTTSLWSCEKASGSNSFYTYFNSAGVNVRYVSNSFGHRIRPVKIPKLAAN